MPNLTLITMMEYRKLSPFYQGYAIYMQAEHDGSELRNEQFCPWPDGSREAEDWHSGQAAAVQDAQDSEE